MKNSGERYQAGDQDSHNRKRRGQNQEISPKNNGGESGRSTQTIWLRVKAREGVEIAESQTGAGEAGQQRKDTGVEGCGTT